MKQYDQESSLGIQQQQENKQYLHTYQTGLLLPLAQSSITGLIASTILSMIAWWVGEQFGEVNLSDMLYLWAITALIITFVTWAFMLWRWHILTGPFERILQRDLNGDGVIGDPSPPQPYRLWIRENPQTQTQMILPCTQDQVTTMAQLVTNGVPFTEANFTGRNRPFSQNQFREIRIALVKSGMIVQRNSKTEKQGFDWTERGLAWIDHVLE